jgi:hypothetical protein
MRRRISRVVAVLAISPSAWAAPADPSVPRLEWRAPPECIGPNELDRLVTEELGRPAFAPGAEELVVRGRVVRAASGIYDAEVELDRISGDALGVRRISSDNRDCRSLDDALVVMLGIMLNVGRAELSVTPPSPWSLRLAAGAAGTLGRMPGGGLEVAVGGGPTLPGVLGFEAEVAIELGPPREREEGRVEARALSGRLGLSPVLWSSGPELALHFAAGAGMLEATAFGFDLVTRRSRLTADVRAGLRLSLPMARPLWLELTGDGGALLVSPRFFVRNSDGSREELYRSGPAFGVLGLSLAFRPR